jgi:hypothetical protein
MRRAVLVTLCAVALAITPTASGAASRVDGHRFGAAGLQTISQGCVDQLSQPTEPARFRIRSGPGDPPSGSHSVGWVPVGDGYAVGPSAQVDQPTSLDILGVSVRPARKQMSGQAVARYRAPGDEGQWIGRVALGVDTRRRWHRVDVGTLPFEWRHYNTEGVQDQYVSSQTIATFTTARGGDGDGAQVGFMYGCDGKAFFIDALRVGTEDGVKKYDFEGYRTRSQLLVAGKARKQITLTFGRKRDLGIRLREVVAGDGLAGKVFVQRRSLSAKKFRTFDKVRTSRTGKAGISVKPTRGTAYRVRYPGGESHEADTSSVLKVRVEFDVTAKLSATSVRRGQTFSMSGRVRPGVRTRAILQRRVGGKWVTVTRGRTARDGSYRLSGSTRATGRTYWRVKASGAKGLVGSASGVRELMVTSPAPPPDEPPPPPDDEPPPPPDDDPPPPPEG